MATARRRPCPRRPPGGGRVVFESAVVHGERGISRQYAAAVQHGWSLVGIAIGTARLDASKPAVDCHPISQLEHAEHMHRVGAFSDPHLASTDTIGGAKPGTQCLQRSGPRGAIAGIVASRCIDVNQALTTVGPSTRRGAIADPMLSKNSADANPAGFVLAAPAPYAEFPTGLPTRTPVMWRSRIC